MNKYSVFTDGSCLNNGKKNSTGAIGIYFSDNNSDNVSQFIENDGNKITNQTMELIACIQALKIINDKIDKGFKVNIIYIYTDSKYVINSMTKWYQNWVKNGWKNSKGKDVDNKDLIQMLYELKSKYIVIFKHVNSHQEEPKDKNNDDYKMWYGNFMADKFATDACKRYLKDKEKSEINKITDEIVNENNGEVAKKKKSIKKKIQNSLNV